MEAIMAIAKEQLIRNRGQRTSDGANCKFSTGIKKKAGTIGHVGSTSFFHLKNLGYGMEELFSRRCLSA
jgi:dTDP-4-amino-4,6-dideoxygalactose transaminase